MIARLGVLMMLAAATARADVTLATHDEGTVYIVTIAHDKVKRVFKGDLGSVDAYAFSDAHTLWVVGRDGTVTRIADGKPTKVTTVAEHRDMLVTKTGEVWVQGAKGYVRVDGEKPVTSATAPTDVIDERPAGPAELPAPPKGYAAHLRDHEGNWGRMQAVTCTAPGGKGRLWSSNLQTATRIAWIMDSPAVLEIDARDPMAYMLTHQPARGSNADVGLDVDLALDGSAAPPAASPPPAQSPRPHHEGIYMEACGSLFEDLYLLGDGLWAATTRDLAVQLKRGARLLGTTYGYDPRISPVVATP